MEVIAFECMSCNGDFEVNVTHFLERPNSLKCSHCEERPSSARCHSLAQALDDLFAAMGAVRTKVRFELTIDNDALPPPYGMTEEEEAQGSLGALGDDDDDDDDDFDDDDDDLDDDFDDDDDIDDIGRGPSSDDNF